MKKTVSINLNGSVFQIDEDAYIELRDYLNAVLAHLSGESEQKEIMSDIEARIAELFTERIHRVGQVVTIEMVDEIIQIMGRPSDYGEESEEKPESSTFEYQQTHKTSRRLYRDPEKAFLAGILSGFAIYLNIDVVWLRIIFVILVLLGVGTIIPIYLVLWLVIPKAETTAQRLEMHGIDVTVENLKAEANKIKERFESYVSSESIDKKKEQIKSEAQRVKENVGNFARSNEVHDAANRIGHVFQAILKAIFAIIAGVVGFAGAVIVIALLIILIVALAAPSWLVVNVPDQLHNIIVWSSTGNLSLLLFALLLFIGIPVYMLFYTAIKVISGENHLSTTAKWVTFLIWLAGFFLLISIGTKIFLVHGWCWM
ncbi:PspC domain-containing protein [Microbacter margulisiae]|uniref:Phage shock protein PspC (Stress-responsive transcriptional regulator) n=1 Tax=Microbacter margulisiae TaxID=1350067 RepID=A0A7W5H0T0_9PORP|nr:PspC domain-containing protein [Microbacter margulisiae]MBB3185884.1 phage shock protein PspC (stress-responsive transcriptional regulator) [Microbacter margulisiae]